jgi:uncharacterized protein YraI
VKIEYSMKFALLALCVTFATTNASALECTVDDPTGTPLNVRSQPNGPIVGALHNGAAVLVSDLILDGSGRRWAKICSYRGRQVRVGVPGISDVYIGKRPD